MFFYLLLLFDWCWWLCVVFITKTWFGTEQLYLFTENRDLWQKRYFLTGKSDLFTEKEVIYNTRSNVSIDVDDNNKTRCTKKMNFKIPKANTTHFGLETISRMGPIIWSFVPEDMKNAKSLDIFKTQVKCLTFDKCPCKICKQYVQGIGYLD